MKISTAFCMCILVAAILAAPAASGKEFHVSVNGDDANDASQAAPLRTISAAAQLAQPGDTITVHEGVYRERITPPRGGESEAQRIVYQAAPGDKVEIKGSEVVTGWEKDDGDTWKVVIPNTFFGDYNPYSDLIRGDWFDPRGREHHTGAVYLDGHWLNEAAKKRQVMGPVRKAALWFGEVDNKNTTLWAQFKGIDPNDHLVEINVRRAVFYPGKPFVNYITVRGFHLRHAAPQWAPPTAEQMGLIGTHWSKGWIIENNDIRYSICTGITLGKYGDEYDNTSANTAEGYVKTIERALANGWNPETIGHHIVRNNTIAYCEEAGLVGSMGAVFSTITGNTIYDINMRNLFGGAEMAGIKIHAAIDTEISHNHIYRCIMGIWLDWMNQGARVSRNLLHDNPHQDLFVEVNHGPFLVDNNVFLSKRALLNMSEGGAYVHNLMAGDIAPRPELGRETPFHKAHETNVAGLRVTQGGDDRFYNNLFIGGNGLAEYDNATLPVFMAGNVFLAGARPSKHEQAPLVLADFDPALKLVSDADSATLQIALDAAWKTQQTRKLVSTNLLGRAKIADLPYVNPDDTPLRIGADYFGAKRDETNPFPGPFEQPEGELKLWPVGEGSK